MNVLALDIGGANIKAAHGAVAGDGAVRGLTARSLPFARWKEPRRLMEKLREAASGLANDTLLVTMTAELCDCFEGRRAGVSHVLDAAGAFASGKTVHVWLTEGRFASIEESREKWLACASANWHAQATWVARLFPLSVSLLIDTGSTTTDITLLRDGLPAARGLTDMARLSHGELIYTGIRRTPLMSLSPVVLFGMPDEMPLHLMAERFATTADIYVLTGNLPEAPKDCDTADGRPLTRSSAAARVVRMVGADRDVFAGSMGEDAPWFASEGVGPEDVTMTLAMAVARACATVQVHRIAESAQRICRAARDVESDNPFAKVDRAVVAGSGDFVAARAAEAALPGTPVVRLTERIGEAGSVVSCAVALLHLWGDPRTGVRGL